jgi:hypothetical protein
VAWLVLKCAFCPSLDLIRYWYVWTGAHTKRLLDKTSPRQNISIQNVYTHNVSLTKRLRNETFPETKRLRNETFPETKRLRNKTSPRHIFNVLDWLFKNGCRIEFLSFVVRLGSAVKFR